MKTLGITAEYNPFHNGHAYQIRAAREAAGAECVIAVMSGDFTQRGEPAVCDKWTRAAAAVRSPEGEDPARADLVIELPFVFACSRASVFAGGAVDMFVSLGVDAISFGCEADDPEELRVLAGGLITYEERIETAKQSLMKSGKSAAKAHEEAVIELLGSEAAELLKEPNNILAIEYLRRIELWRSRGVNIEDVPIIRYGAGYKDAAGPAIGFAGAGALRNMLKQGNGVRAYMPGTVQFEDINSMQDEFFRVLRGIVLRSTPEELAAVCGIGEGLENRIIREIRTAADLDDLTGRLVSRRYTEATIRRALTHLLVGSGWDSARELTETPAGCGRVLAARDAGRRFMRVFSSDDFRIITNINKELEGLPAQDRKLMEMDIHAADMYNLISGRDLYDHSDKVIRPYIE